MKMDARNGKVRARVSAEQKARDDAVRKEFTNKPGLEELVASGKYLPPIKMEDYFEFARFAKTMRKCREEMGMTMAAVAEEAGMEEAALSRLERAQGNPTIRTVSRWVRAVGKRLTLGLAEASKEKSVVGKISAKSPAPPKPVAKRTRKSANKSK